MAVQAVTSAKEDQEATTTSLDARTVRSRIQRALCKSDYATFIRLAVLYGRNLITRSAFREKLQYLLHGHPDAIAALNRLPGFPRIHRKLPSRHKRIKKTLSESITAVNYVKNRCGGDVEKYRRFLAAVEGYRTGKSTKEQVYEEIYDMFDAGPNSRSDAEVAKKIGALFGLARPPYVYLPEKHRDPILEREDLPGLDIFGDPENPPRFKFKLSDVLNNTVVLRP